MKTIIFALPKDNPLAYSLAEKLHIEMGIAEVRDFPDGETYVRIDTDVRNKTILLVCALDHPNHKFLSLVFMAKTLKSLGADSVHLISPYLPYMRQDKQFRPGEAVTSTLFAKLISGCIDSLLTVDPHLHRIKNIADIYAVPTKTLHATKPIADWIQNHTQSPLIIGPDEESKQWVSEVAEHANAPYIIAKKIRHGDKSVTISLPDLEDDSKIPILVDDIISTGTSMIAATQQLLSRKFINPICITVHALFTDETHKNLLAAGVKQIISCNTIQHPSNQIDITDILIAGISSSKIM